MFSFDESGNVLIDTEQSDAISRATANRTISARATALTRGQYSPISPVHASIFAPFLRDLGERFKAVGATLRGGVARVPHPRGPTDLTMLGNRAVSDWIATDLQGFEGPLPILEMNGTRIMDYLLPADGAVIRYLGRLLRKSKGLISVDILRNGDGRPIGVRTVDASDAVNPSNPHTMRLRVNVRYSDGTSGRFDGGTVESLVALLKIMDIQEEFPTLLQVLRTLSRKLHSTDGNWGEAPKFPIVNFRDKIAELMRGESVEVQQVDNLFHGNSQRMYSDKSVYDVIDATLKQALISTKPISGAAPWITPTQA